LAPDRLLASLDDGRVVALKPTSGDVLWEQKLGGTPGDIATADGRVYVGSKDGYLYCLSLNDGRIRWRWQTGGAIIGRPIVDDRLVYFLSMDNQLRALDRVVGNQRWKTALPARASHGLCLLDGRILTASNAALDAFQRRDGVAAGSYAAPADQILAGLPHVAPGLSDLDAKIFFLTGEGEIVALQSATKAPAAEKTPGSTRRPEPGGD
jgi:outer membrane protein assembly factor BamB